MAATELGIFEALGSEPISATEVAERCSTDPRATEKLLFALAAAGYARAGRRLRADAEVAQVAHPREPVLPRRQAAASVRRVGLDGALGGIRAHRAAAGAARHAAGESVARLPA